MKKIYSFFVAAMFATASFAQEQATITVSPDVATTVEDGKYYLLHKIGSGNGGPQYLSNGLAGAGIWASTEHDNTLKYVWKVTKTDEKVSFQNVGTGGYIASLLTAVGGGDGGALLKTVINVDNAAKLSIVDRGNSTFNFGEDKPVDSPLSHSTYYLDCNNGSATVWHTQGGNADYQLYEVTLNGDLRTVELTINDTYDGTQVTSTMGTSSYAVGHSFTLPTGAAPIGLVRNVLFNGTVVTEETFTVTEAGTLSFNFAKDFTNLPFTPSTSFDDLKWHNITIRGTKVWTVDGEEVHAMEGADTAAEAAQWAIVESDNLATKGWYIVNRSMPDKVLTLALNDNGGIDNGAVAIFVDKDPDAKQWSIHTSGDNVVVRLMNDNTVNAYANDFGGNGIIKTWANAGALNDPGSRISFTAVETTSIQGAKVADEVETVYFDLNGRKVSKLVSGKVYITNKGVKVLVK